MKKVSVLIPAYNEEKSLPKLYDSLSNVMNNNSAYDWEIFFVNDGSKDRTLSIIKNYREKDNRISYIDLSRNFGKEVAMLAGFDHVSGDCMIIMDADLQDPPEIIPEMLSKWEEGYEDVYAKRKDRGKESYLRRKFSLLFYKLLQTTTKIEVLQNVGDFRLLDRSCINILKQIREKERYTKGMFSWIGFKKASIDFDRHDRVAGESSWNFLSLLNLAIEGITSFTIAPLRLSSIIGVFISVLSFIYMFYIIIKSIFWGEVVQGFPTIMVTILFLGGIQLLSLGFIGEYLGRVFNESKNRPTYVVREINGVKQFGK